MTPHDLQSSKRKKIKKRIGCVLMLISLPVFFSGALFPVDCFPPTPGCLQWMKEMNDLALALSLSGILLFISGFILFWTTRRRATINQTPPEPR